MKKIVLLFLLVVTTTIKAQSDYKDLPGRWRLGFNMGGIWESSDVKPSPGLGGGFTIEKILNKRANALLGFSLGLRYLGGRTYGLAATPTYDISKNEALNGTYNPVIRYDTMPGYFFANHKTFIQEGSLELKMNFPRLEKNTGIIFHLWGGIGIGKYKTWIDALDKDGNMYDFSRLQGQHISQSDLTRIYDGKYETLAMGSGTNGTFCVLPSLGAGLGYHLSKHVSLVLEHKISFPGTNLLDGIEYPKNCPVTGSKDFYNYTSVGLVFTFYGQHRSHASSSSTHNTTPVGTQTVANNNSSYTAPVVHPPTVVITYPANNFNSAYDYTTVNATIHNVSSAQQISISQNGYTISHFAYNANNGALNFQTFLALGTNNFVISVTNSGGTASQGVTINYVPVPTFTTNGLSTTSGTTVTTTNTVVTTNTVATTGSPTVNPVFTTTVTPTSTVSATHTVSPTFTTVTTSTVATTTTVTPTFTVSPTHTVAASGSVTPTFTTAATGTVSPADGPFHGNATVTPLKPVVSFIDPNVYPAETTNATYNVIGSVLNVSGASQVFVSVNGNTVPDFVYNPTNKQVTFVAVLQLGYNTITIKGTNNNGSDSKSMVINHKQAGRPPKVHIANPSTSPFTSLQSNMIVSGYVYNVVSSSDINVTANGAPTPFNYNLNTHEITIALNLAQGNTTVNVAATNPFGSDAGTITLIYKKIEANNGGVDSVGSVITHTHVETAQTHTYTNTPHGPPGGPHNAPVITVLSPNADPFNTNTGNISVSAMVDYISNASLVTVNYNGVPLSVMFDMASKHLNFSSPLKPGLNTFIISASNNDGTVNKSVNVNYAPIGGNTNPSNSTNPGSGNGPTYGHGGWNMGGIFNNGGGKTDNTINPPTDPKKTNPTPGGGIINPGRPVKTVTPSTETPKPSNDSGTTPNKPMETGGSQIRVKPR
ncbi:MAG: hypothetical protein ACXVPN_01185 [Bacteroidia bacterium]